MSSNSDEEQTRLVDSLMVKLNSAGHGEDTTFESRHDYGCYICGASNPNWHVYAKPQSSSTKIPFFPFLEYHQPTASARPIERESGKVAVCTVCFSFLTQQWRAFEDKETPIVKRIYWLKRPGSEIPEGIDKDIDRSYDMEEGLVDHVASTDVEVSEHHHTKVKSKSQISTAENVSNEETTLYAEKQSNEAPTELGTSSKVIESPVSFNASCINKKKASLEFCFVCSRQKPKEFMRSVHTRPQLKTETPFYPCLTKHNPAILAKKMDFLGKVLVCEACQKFLFRQWQVFQKNNTPLSERQYQLRSDPSLPREQQSQLSTMVCFICGVTQPATSGRFLYSRKHAPGDPYYPFLNKLQPPPGAMPLTKQGLTRACSGCRKSLHRQWKEFQLHFVAEEDREYRIRNDGTPVSVTSLSTSPLSLTASFTQPIMNHDSSSLLLPSSLDNKKNESQLLCYTCGEPCDKSIMKSIYTRKNTHPSKENFYFPFIALLEGSAGSQPLDQIGRTLVCKNCYKYLQTKWEQFERKQVPQQMRVYASGKKANTNLKPQINFCFLCGVKSSTVHLDFKLHTYPHNGEGVKDGGSFFPFLATCEPKPNASPISSEGTVLACEICFTNLMVQWYNFENSSHPKESNRWLRKYQVDFIVCYSCGKQTPRENCSSVSKSCMRFQTRFKLHKGSLLVNRKQDVVVCDTCHRATVQQGSDVKRLYPGYTMARELDETIHEETRRTESSHFISKNKKPVIVIDSSDSEDDNSLSLLAKQKSRYSRSHRHANTGPMHYTPSASPGVSQTTAPIKDYPPSLSPSASMQPTTSRSFAAALRKLAKQAMPTGGSSPATSSCSSSQPASPTVSHSSSRSAGVSPSRNSPATTQTPPPSRGEGAISKERQSLPSERELHNISTPPMSLIPALESDDSNPTTGEPKRVSSLGPHRHSNREQSEPTSNSKGHEVIPGVYSTKPRYQSEPNMISEHGYPTEHGHPVVPYYLHGVRPDVPIFIPRGAPLPGPPPLLASKRDGGDPHAVSPYFQGVYPPSIIDSPDMHFETWRQQRAVEHLRQQHERQERPMTSMSGHSDLSSPKDRTSEKEKIKEGGSSSEPSGQRMYFNYNEQSKPSSCPVHGHSPGEPHQHKHNAVRSEPLPTTKPDRPEEFNRLFLPPHPEGPAMLHPYIVHPSRDVPPFGHQHLGERQAEMLRERGRQEFIMHQRMMIDPREHMKAREEEWQHRQQRLRQEKEEHQREMVQYRHHVLQQQREMEQPIRVGDQSGLDPRRSDHRQTDHRERFDKSPQTNDRRTPDNEMYRHYPFHPAFHPLPHDIRARLPFPDLQRKDAEAHRGHMETFKDGRNPQPHPFGLHDQHFRPFSDPYPFHQDRLSARISGTDRLFTDAGWTAHTRPTYINGDLRTADVDSSEMGSKLSEVLSARIKKEGQLTDQASGQHPIQPKHHDKEKLRFLEGLGLVTLEKKKELTHGDPSVKRKFEERQETPSQDDKASTASNGREETEETSSEGTTDVESGTTSTDTEISSKQYKEKINFMARLGLVPPQTREEMEQSYEVKRSERKKRKKKGRGRPSKRSRKDTSGNNEIENGRSSNDAENLGGPITRQKQQLLEQGLLKQDKLADKPEMNGKHNKDISAVKIKKEASEEPSYPYSIQENRYQTNNESGRYHPSPPISSESLSSRPPPRLTLQSLTNMEDPFNNYNTPTFRPPYLRHTGLLSVSQDSNHQGTVPIGKPLRPEPIRSTGLTLSEQETRDYLAHHGSPGVPPDFNRHYSHQGSSYDKMIPTHLRPEVDAEKKNLGTRAPPFGRKDHEYKWPGVESVMKAYFLHSGECDHELSFLQENASKLKSQQATLNQEASNLNTQMTNLVETKKHLHDEKKVCRENLDRLHYFMQSFQR